MTNKKLGFWTSSSLVVGNMIGSGIFLLPATLAAFGSISLFGWLVSAIGAGALAFVFIALSKQFPASSGGPYIYSRKGLGDFAGFLVAWGYWISVWCTNGAIAVAFISYLSVFFPVLADNHILSTAVGLGTIWILTWINTRGIRSAGLFQFITSALKIIPLLAIGIVGLFYIKWEHFQHLNISENTNLQAIVSCATLTFFAFMGLESATIPAADVDKPEKTIPKATYFGLSLTTLIYLLSSFALMGMIPATELQHSNAPFSDAGKMIWGSGGETLVALGAILSTLGALNGWILIQGQIPAAIAKDQLFPKVFAKENRQGTPVFSIVFSSLLVSVLLVMNYTKGLGEAFKFILLLASMTALIAYLFTAASAAVVLFQDKAWNKSLFWQLVLVCLAFIFSIWAIAGSGMETVYWGFLLLIAGLPFYAWMLIRKK